MPKRTPVRVPAGTNISVGPLRIYVAANRNGLCDTFVTFGTTGLGHREQVPEAALLDLQDAAEHLVDFSTVEIVTGEPVGMPDEPPAGPWWRVPPMLMGSGTASSAAEQGPA